MSSRGYLKSGGGGGGCGGGSEGGGIAEPEGRGGGGEEVSGGGGPGGTAGQVAGALVYGCVHAATPSSMSYIPWQRAGAGCEACFRLTHQGINHFSTRYFPPAASAIQYIFGKLVRVLCCLHFFF